MPDSDSQDRLPIVVDRTRGLIATADLPGAMGSSDAAPNLAPAELLAVQDLKFRSSRRPVRELNEALAGRVSDERFGLPVDEQASDQ
jgi:hypothetical protein